MATYTIRNKRYNSVITQIVQCDFSCRVCFKFKWLGKEHTKTLPIVVTYVPGTIQIDIGKYTILKDMTFFEYTRDEIAHKLEDYAKTEILSIKTQIENKMEREENV